MEINPDNKATLNKQEILKARAQVMTSLEEESDSDQDGQMQLVEFQLANEHYCIETQHVQEVSAYKDFTPLPGSSSALLGLINIRGKIYSLLDLKNIFGLECNAKTRTNVIILLNHPDIYIGIVADNLIGMTKIAGILVQPTLETFSGKKFEYLKGVTPDGLAVINVDKIFYEQSKTN